ncbi:baculoviral IAP repeat-containing protein 7-like [Momordica charantia]|uniref:Baculoviral IAP repeat-containing protein 7-like n=1 Tax=Momordica charantia TaxID=3673 RepID=A0A6J1D257_MOMCH|nr:baculoviral IAP repeat-containing protein 7-like [Momordica charantia]
MIEGLSRHGSSRREDAARSSAASGMNLAMALAAERNLRGDEGGPAGAGDVKSLMRLFEEMDGVDWKTKRKEGENNGVDWMCCVCMERSKGAAFIPCGHAFCRVCSRELWLNRGTCPICNRSIIEILDIF